MLEEGIAQGIAPPIIQLRRRRAVGLVVLFTAASFLGSGLLFLVEPMVSKLLLPHLGGAAAVWNTALVFFQFTLLLGYGWAHLTIKKLGPRRHWFVQSGILLLSLLALPVAIPADWLPGDTPPAMWTLAALVVAVGGPFFVLSTSSPTLQRWLSFTNAPGATDPYFLYAAGNAGSLIGLLGYPLIVEPALTLQGQSRLWSYLFGAFVIVSIAAGFFMLRHRSSTATAPATHTRLEVLGWGRRMRWLGWSAVPSALLIGVTHHVSTDIAAFPLLWVVPLAIYLVTFIIAFGPNPNWLSVFSDKAVRLLALPVAVTFIVGLAGPVQTLIPHVLFFAFAAMLAHGRLANDRPTPFYLTEYFLLMSVGGAIGGLLTALVAPMIFSGVFEYPLAIVGAVILVTQARRLRHQFLRIGLGVVMAGLVGTAWWLLRTQGESRAQLAAFLTVVAVGLAYTTVSRPRIYALVVAGVIAVGLIADYSGLLDARRTFFGVYRVTAEDGFRLFHSGTTIHGAELLEHPGQPVTYFHRLGPMGLFMESRSDLPPQRIAIVGLGVGTLAAYGRPGDSITFFEIDQAVADIALAPDFFTYLAQPKAEVDIKIGDGRLLLEAEASKYDLIILDAFSSDSIPVHLITQEALDSYLDHLAPGGVLAYNVSNRYIDVAPILARQARERSLYGLKANDFKGDRATGKSPSRWVFLAREASHLQGLDEKPFEPLGNGADAPLWTDSYSNVLQVIDF